MALALDSKHWSPPMYAVGGGFITYGLEKDASDGIVWTNDDCRHIRVPFSYTFLPGAVLDGYCIADEGKVTLDFAPDGTVKPSGRTLRIYSADKVSAILKHLYKGGNPRNGSTFRRYNLSW